MNPSILVLANLSEAAAQAARYAAVLGAPIRTHLALLNLYHDAVLDPELVTVTTAHAYRNQAETAAALRALARSLPAPAEVTVSSDSLLDAVQAAVRRHQPLLLAMGLSTEHDWLDGVLLNQALPVLQATHRPLLLVPETAGAPAHLPRRVLIAADAEPFKLNAASHCLAALFEAWQAAYTVAHITSPQELRSFPGHLLLRAARTHWLLPATAPLALYAQPAASPAAGLLRALEDTQADLLVLVTRPRSFLGQLFHHSVTAQVLRRSRVPVLLLPSEAPPHANWW